MIEEEKYMYRCIQLAHNGLCNTPPNPMVGAVIVCNGKIIGEGYHIRCGEAHAEVNAIRSVKDQSLLEHSTIYVSLEPCSHYGKTPPCVDLILEKKIPRIVIGCQDPFVEVSGRGIRKLKAAGREVITGVLEIECQQLISRFITYHMAHRPYITLKWAESADGFIDILRTNGHPVILSNTLSRILTHKRRAEHSCILAGTNTVLLDNPSLNVRYWYGNNPVRVILDRELKLSNTLHVLDGNIPTIVITEKPCQPSHNIEYVVIDFTRDILPQILSELHKRGLQSVLIEGGKMLLQSFIDAGLWDEAYIERSPAQLNVGVKSPKMIGGKNCDITQIFNRNILHYRPQS